MPEVEKNQPQDSDIQKPKQQESKAKMVSVILNRPYVSFENNCTDCVNQGVVLSLPETEVNRLRQKGYVSEDV